MQYRYIDSLKYLFSGHSKSLRPVLSASIYVLNQIEDCWFARACNILELRTCGYQASLRQLGLEEIFPILTNPSKIFDKSIPVQLRQIQGQIAGLLVPRSYMS